MKKSQLENYIVNADESSQIIINSLFRVNDLVKSFKQLAISKTSESTQAIQLHDIVDAVRLVFSHKFSDRPIMVVNRISTDLTIRGVPNHYTQIITNLLSNAYLHAFEGKETGEVTIQAHKNGDFLTLTFEDNGCGVAESDLKNIFEPFFTTKRNKGGTGIGLSIIKNITTRLNGRTKVWLNPSNGLTFEITTRCES